MAISHYQYLVLDTLPGRAFTAKLFFKLLSVVYFVAFVTILLQVEILYVDGIISYRELVEKTYEHEGYIAILHYPSIFWICQNNIFIYIVFFSAALLSLYGIFFSANALFFLI